MRLPEAKLLRRMSIAMRFRPEESMAGEIAGENQRWWLKWNSSHHDVDQFPRVDLLHDLLAGKEALHLGIGQSLFDYFVFWSSRRNNNHAAQLSVHLDGDLNFFFLGQFRIVLRPRIFQQIALLA